MVRLIFFFVIFLLSVWVGVLIKHEPGYFLIMVNRWSIEMPLWVGAFILIVAFVLFHYGLNFLRVIGYSRSALSNWFERRKLKNAHSYSTRSLLAFTEGQWANAEKYALRALPNSDCKLIDYLVAARSAQHLGAIDRRDHYFRKAKQVAPQEKIAVELTQAQLQIESCQNEQALATVKHLYDVMPKHPFVVKLLYQLYLKLADWKALMDLLPSIRKSDVVTTGEFEELERIAYYRYFQHATFSTVSEVEDFWMRLPKFLRKEPRFIRAYCGLLNQFDASQAAETHLKIALKRSLDDDLIELYGKTRGPNPAGQLSLAEHWLSQQPTNATLLAALAQLSMVCEYWGKAKDYFKESLAQRFDKDVCAAYAALLDKLGEKEQALVYYRRAVGKN